LGEERNNDILQNNCLKIGRTERVHFNDARGLTAWLKPTDDLGEKTNETKGYG